MVIGGVMARILGALLCVAVLALSLTPAYALFGKSVYLVFGLFLRTSLFLPALWRGALRFGRMGRTRGENEGDRAGPSGMSVPLVYA